MKRPSEKTVSAQLDGVCAVCDEADAFYAEMIRSGWNGIFARRFRAGLLLIDAADVMHLAERTDPRGPNGNFDNSADGRAIKRFATRNGCDEHRFAHVAYSLILEHLRRSNRPAKR